MKIIEVDPRPAADFLPGADFVDAWCAEGVAHGASAEDLAGHLRQATPGWIKYLLAARNILVAPFGLKTDVSASNEPKPMFPVISSQPDRVILGMDDKHLDFRLVVEVLPEKTSRVVATTRVVTTTYVRTHNLGGRLYIAVVKPFHRIIVPAMLRAAIARSQH